MTIQPNHLIVPARGRQAAAERLATLLGVPWAATAVGTFSPFYVNAGLTLDVDTLLARQPPAPA